MKFKLLFLLLIFSLSFGNKNQVLYLMNTQQHEKAINCYQKFYQETNEQDFEILQQMALLILEKGAKSSDPKEKQLAMFGAGLAASTKSLKILEKGLFSEDLATQLTALHFICALQDNEVDNLLIKAMNSNFLETRIEAAFQMAHKKHPCALGLIQSLMQKLPPMFRPFFPQFFGLIGSNDATQVLKNLLFDKDPNVCVQSILSIAQNQRDDLLYLLRKKTKHASIAEQEALAYSLALLNDSSCLDSLQKYCTSSTPNARLAAALALYQLGNKTYKKEIIKAVLDGNLFAIFSLKKIDGTESLLVNLSKFNDLQIRMNASIALLYQRNPSCLLGLEELLITRNKELVIEPTYSVGRALNCFKISLNSKRRKDLDCNLSLDIKQLLLKEALELDESSFLSFAEKIFYNNKNDLVPFLCSLLATLNTDKALALLKDYASQIGSPLIRDYCNLTLYRMNIEGPYFDYLKAWLQRNKHQKMIELKTFSPNKIRYEKSQYELSPEESSRLLIETFMVLAEKHQVEGIMLLLDILKTTHKSNIYPLAGLLLRATE